MGIVDHSFIVKDSLQFPKGEEQSVYSRVKLFGMLHISASNILDVRNIVKNSVQPAIIFQSYAGSCSRTGIDIVGNGA